MFDRSVGKKPVPYIASSRTSTGGSMGTWPCATARSPATRGRARHAAVGAEAIEREREQRGVADEVAEARAGQTGGSLHLEPADLGVFRPRRGRRAPAPELLRILLRVAVGNGRIRGIRHLLEQLVALVLGGGQLRLDRAQILLDSVQLLELLRRRLALQ